MEVSAVRNEAPPNPHVLHVVGRYTPAKAHFLEATIRTLAHEGASQRVILVDSPEARTLRSALPPEVDLMLLPAGRQALQGWSRLLAAFSAAIREPDVRAIHLHGFLTCLVCSLTVRVLRVHVPIYQTPYGSRWLDQGGVAASILLWPMRPLLGHARPLAITSTTQEARSLALLMKTQAEVVEYPAAEAYFHTRRDEASHPLVVTSGDVDMGECADAFARWAVLLGNQPLNLSFQWLGPVDPSARTRLQAAGVTLLEPKDKAERAACLAAAWIYLAPSRTPVGASGLIEAMAVGLPCVAIDTPEHREVLRDGDTGFLCRTDEEVLECLAILVDHPHLREQVGLTARDQAARRFSEPSFRDSLLSAYGL